MSFAPRPIDPPLYQRRQRIGVNPPAFNRPGRQTVPIARSHNLRDSYGNNQGNNKVADFTARRNQQLSPVAQLEVSTPAFVQPTPWWLRSLFYLNYGSGFLTTGLIIATLITYGSVVSTQKQWSEEYRQLESLRRTERQLITANEVIKNQAAQQSTKSKELVRVDPYKRVYLPTPTPATPAPKGNIKPSPNINPPATPLGY